MSDNDIKSTYAFPQTPFLLIDEAKEDSSRYIVVEHWEESDIEVLRDCHFMQNIEITGHKASAEEIAKFLKEEEKDEVDDYLYKGDIAPGHGGQGYERR